MRDGEVDGDDDRLQRLIQLERDFVQVPSDEQDSRRDYEQDGVVRRWRGKDDGAEHGHGADDAEREPVQRHGLEIVQHRQVVLLRRDHDTEEEVEAQQRQSARDPAAEEFSDDELVARDGLGEEREEGAVLALRRDLPRRGGDGDDQRRGPDQEEADLLEVAHDLVLPEDADGTHHQRDERGEHEQDVEILAATQFLDDHTRDGGDVVPGTRLQTGGAGGVRQLDGCGKGRCRIHSR